MNREQARHLLQFINEPQNKLDLKFYMEMRIQELYKLLEFASNNTEMNKLQGAIQELRRLATLEDEIKQKAE